MFVKNVIGRAMLKSIRRQIKEKIFLRIAIRLNDYYIEKYLNDPNIKNLKNLVFYSNDIDSDIDLIAKWNFCYPYEVNREYYHSHSFRNLLLQIIDILFVLFLYDTPFFSIRKLKRAGICPGSL